MELWEIGAILGVHHPDEDGPSSNGSGERDLIAERIAYAAGTGPKPEPDPSPPLSPEVSNLITRVP